MAAHSFFSTYISSTVLSSRFPTPNRPTLSVSRTFAHRNLHTACILASLRPSAHRNHSPAPESAINKFIDSFVVLITSVALSVSVFVTDVDSAAAFVVTPSRKLQTDELATVRLFQENTPSVVYITNLAARQDAFTLDVLEVPQGSGSGFVWDKNGHVVTNYHVIRGASDLRLVKFFLFLEIMMLFLVVYMSISLEPW
ncbi:putative peptidase S1, PA clan [Helianthus anomalus]